MVLVGSIVAAACTNDGGRLTTLTTTTTTPATDPDGATPGSLIDAAFGTQAVQDFVIHIALAREADDSPESFYTEVLEEAASGAEASTGAKNRWLRLTRVRTEIRTLIRNESCGSERNRADVRTLRLRAGG